MLPLTQAIHSLPDQHWLVGQTLGLDEALKVWIYRKEYSYSLYVYATAKNRLAHRNAVGRDLASIEEVLETLTELEVVYRVTGHQLLNMPTFIRPALPEQVLFLEQIIQTGPRATV